MTASTDLPESAEKGSAWRWRAAADAPAGVDDIVAHWDRLEELPGAEILKSNLLRDVIALPAAGARPAAVVKRYRVRPGRDRWKSLVVPSRALREWRALRHLQAGGVSVPRVWAIGEAHAGLWLAAAGLILERVAGAVPLPRWLDLHRGSARQSTLQRLGRELGRLHLLGVGHPDLHAGNVLVVGSGENVVLIDHHSARLGAARPRDRRRADLAKLVHSLLDTFDGDDLRAVVRGYADTTGDPMDDGAISKMCGRLRRRARRLERIRLGSRSRRCWKTTSDFVRERFGRWRVHRRRELSLEDLRPLLEGEFEFADVFKERRGQRVGRLTISCASGERRELVAKVREVRSVARRLACLFTRDPLERAWGAARALEVRDIPTPRALALAVAPGGVGRRRTILITEFAAGSRTLHRDLLDRFHPPARQDRTLLHRQAEALAALVRRLHETGVYHRDLNPMNILVGGDDPLRFLLVDLDSIHLGRRLGQRRRHKNLVQLGLLPEGHIGARDRLRFLRAYDHGARSTFRRSCIAELSRDLEREIVAIIVRMSIQELTAGVGAVGDERFRSVSGRGTSP